jgi:NADPH:quinone reductase-like Zn-dependent oxidoreductase
MSNPSACSCGCKEEGRDANESHCLHQIRTAVTGFQKGDQVYAMNITRFGMYAAYTCLPENSVLAFKPSNVTCKEAAAVPFGGLLALHFLRKSQIQRGQHVLIYGASGAVGTAGVQLARHFGAEVTGVCSTTNLGLVKSLGADSVIDYTQEDATTGGERYDVIFDAVGKRKSSPVKSQCHQALTSKGKYLSVDDGSPQLHSEDLHFLTELMEAGQLQAVIDRCYPLQEMVEAHRYVEQGPKRAMSSSRSRRSTRPSNL